ncbi:hypothetical protein LOD99_15294 [Oopsacas minuta]|uniref:Uncharacterized protein n=1 Tax=Oopsacas minuta TaxID=111878 RepID=A0AAV7KD22_9METZ|nr:hypothetical protein LOD99_15294 [Oopsacas minuta]
MIATTGHKYRDYNISTTQVIPIEPANKLSLLDPRCIAIDNLAKELYIGETHEGFGSVMTILIHEQIATCVHVISSGLVRPSGIAFTDLNIFVSDSFTNSIICYSKAGELIYEVGSASDVEFCWPTSIQYYLEVVYVCDWGNGRIVAFDTALTNLFEFKEMSICPIDLAIHSNCVFVVTQKPLLMGVFTLEGNFITIISLNLPKFTRIKQFTIDPAGNFIFTSPIHRFLYFLNLERGEIVEINLFDIFSFTPSAIAVYKKDKIISLSNSGVQLFNIF